MSTKVNPEIKEYIDNSEFDDKIKDCLNEILNLELKRYKDSYNQYSADYNRLLESYLVK